MIMMMMTILIDKLLKQILQQMFKMATLSHTTHPGTKGVDFIFSLRLPFILLEAKKMRRAMLILF
jgi:hypothetical protein